MRTVGSKQHLSAAEWRRLTALLAMAIATLAACADPAPAAAPNASGEAGAAGQAGGTAGCPAGHLTLDDGSCQPAGLPDMTCPPGEQEDAQGGCVPAGVPPDACAESFTHDDDGGCEPVLPDEPCEIGEMAVPGETLCRAVAPCRAGTWGDIPVEATTEYVNGSYAGGSSNGSAAQPWTTIAEGLEHAPAGAVVAVHDVGSWGVYCTDTHGPGSLALHSSLVEGATSGGVLVEGATITVGSSVVRDTQAGASTDRGITAWPGPNTGARASLLLTGALVERNRDAGVLVVGSDATVTGTVARDTFGQQDSYGVVVTIHEQSGRGALSLTGSLLERNAGAGLAVAGSDATVDTSVSRLNTSSDDSPGTGVLGLVDPASLARLTLTLCPPACTPRACWWREPKSSASSQRPRT